MNTHLSIVQALEARLEELCPDDLYIEHEFKVKNKIGECDLVALVNKYAIAIEVKSTNSKKSRRKAQIQLRKDYQWLRGIDSFTRFWGFYAYGNGSDKGYTLELIHNGRH